MIKEDQLAKKKIAVAYGGISAEREVSLRSGDAVFNALRSAGLQVVSFDPKFQSLSELSEQQVDIVWNALHGRGGEDGLLPAALSYLGIWCTGSNVSSSALSMDKWRSKMIWKAMGLPVANHVLVKSAGHSSQSDLRRIFAKLGPAVFVKPSREGSSVGMSKAHNVDELEQALLLAGKFDHEILVESFIKGKEYTVSILGNKALPSIRMETPREFYDYTAKYESSDTQYFCPSGLCEADENRLRSLAIEAFKALGCSGWGRVDFIYDEQNHDFKLLEVNTVPGMTETSLVPKAALQAGINFEELTKSILMLSDD